MFAFLSRSLCLTSEKDGKRDNVLFCQPLNEFIMSIRDLNLNQLKK